MSAHEESTWCCGEHQTSWEAAGAPQDRLWPASRVRTTARTPCRATGAVDRAICCSQVAGALESRVCVGVGGFPSQRVGSNVRGITRLTHAKCHWRHGAASELHLARHQPRAPAPHILCVSRLVPREPRSVEMGSVGKPRAARMPLAPSVGHRGLCPSRDSSHEALQWGSATKSKGLRTMVSDLWRPGERKNPCISAAPTSPPPGTRQHARPVFCVFSL